MGVANPSYPQNYLQKIKANIDTLLQMKWMLWHKEKICKFFWVLLISIKFSAKSCHCKIRLIAKSLLGVSIFRLKLYLLHCWWAFVNAIPLINMYYDFDENNSQWNDYQRSVSNTAFFEYQERRPEDPLYPETLDQVTTEIIGTNNYISEMNEF